MSNVQSVERALAILEQLARGQAGVSELAKATDLPKSTVARLLSTLEAQEAVDRPPDSTDYRLGPAIADLAATAPPNRGLIAVTHPHIAGLTKAVGEAAGLSVADGYRVQYVAQIESPTPVQVRDWTGSRIPMHLVPSGIVFLAHWPEEGIARYLDRELEETTALSVVEPQAIRDRLSQARKDGYAWVFEEFTEGINSVAAPILNAEQKPVGALHIHGPAYRFPAPREDAAVGELIARTSEGVSEQLAG